MEQILRRNKPIFVYYIGSIFIISFSHKQKNEYTGNYIKYNNSSKITKDVGNFCLDYNFNMQYWTTNYKEFLLKTFKTKKTKV